MPSKEYEGLVEKVRANRPQGKVSLEDSRAFMEKTGSIFTLPEDVVCEKVDAGGVPGEWISAPGAATDKAVFYLHGGGYVMGSIDTHRELVARISRESGMRALSIEYRLAPEHPFPAGLDDAVAAYRWLLAQGIAAGQIVIAGDSAGGGLTLATMLALREAGDPLPAGAVTLSPWTDLTCSGGSVASMADVDPMVNSAGLYQFAKYYMGNQDLKTPHASPLFADLKGLPPLLIQVGTHEVLLDDSRRLADNAKAAGVDVTLELGEELMHVWQWFAPMIPEGREAVARIGEYIKARVA